MFEVIGKHATIQVMLDEGIEAELIQKLHKIANHPAFAGSKIVIMPDCHEGEGACIGFTMTIGDNVIPNVVGVDIGCGVSAVNIGKGHHDFALLDEFIRHNIPLGFNHRDKPINVSPFFKDKIDAVCTRIRLNPNDVIRQLGTLGGGNHFIEIDKDDKHNYWLVIHSGSRNFGMQVASYHQNLATDNLIAKHGTLSDQFRTLAYLPMDEGGVEYLQDMEVAQQFAMLNREAIQEDLLEWFDLDIDAYHNAKRIESVHNYINFKDNILRKGAISANKGEKLLIPFNMRDGVAVCVGKGNADWNNSAPHGAGRILSRGKAKRELTLEAFTASMKGIFSTSVSEDTLDESPMAYKNKEVILNAIEPTVTVDFIMKPVYNIKASESRRRR